MNGGVSTRFDDDDLRPAARRPHAPQTIIYGDLVVGVLDFLDATIFNALRGVLPLALIARGSQTSYAKH